MHAAQLTTMARVTLFHESPIFPVRLSEVQVDRAPSASGASTTCQEVAQDLLR